MKPDFLEPKKARLRHSSGAWLKRADAFKAFLTEHHQELLELPYHVKNYGDLMNQMVAEEQYTNLRTYRYSEWLKTAESLMYLQGNSKALRDGKLRLMISLDYKRFYDSLLFEFHYYLSRACFCKLALYHEVNINPRTLDFELDYLVNHLSNMFKENQNIHKSAEFIDLFLHAYRSAMMDLCLYHDIKLNVMSKPLFSLNDLMSSKEINNPNQQPNHKE